MATEIDDDAPNPFHHPNGVNEAARPGGESLLDIHLGDSPPVAGLEFQDLPHTGDPDFHDYGGSPGDDRNSLLDGGRSSDDLNSLGAIGSGGANSSFFSIDYYRQFYDVTTMLVLVRLGRGFVPNGKPFFREGEKADLYGPFWICTTLIFLMAAGGNFADYLHAEPGHAWKYNFRMVNWAAWVFYSAITVIPVAVWFALNRHMPKLLVDIIALYGYSFIVYIPACILCTFPSVVLRVLVMLVATAVSTVFLVSNLAKPEERKTVIPILLAVSLCHLGIGFVSYKWFFSFD
eukprot:gb/GEZN01010625.1/.p1 GENE.gb/GEZN01010625.1/~~gb/GEZN01010625.1/.p1  ORF type:complete len:290 (-),score=36.01 gb/GEZN01010625.1/:334-1203(-)